MTLPTTFDAQKLEQFCYRVFLNAGVPSDNAKTVAESLLQADLRGVDSHGVVRTDIYIKRLEAGMVDPHAVPQIAEQNGSTALIDGRNNYGAVVGASALSTALDIADRNGVSAVGVKGSNHFGTCAYYGLQAVARDYILVALSNASQTMPPTGGVRPFIGTNPLSISVPAGEMPPFILDMATSVVARGKIIVAAQKGLPIPLGWAVDKHGNDTTDAHAALEGAVLPLGGAKGYAISMFIDILSGVLTGAGFGKYVNNMYENWNEPQNVGHMFIAIKIDHFMPVAWFKQRMDQYIREIKSEPRAPGVNEILIPGEIEHRLTAERLQNGIVLPEKVVRELQAIGTKYDVDLLQAAK